MDAVFAGKRESTWPIKTCDQGRRMFAV